MNADPRRPEKILRYVSNTNGNGQEELAPEYTNTLGQYQTPGNAPEPEFSSITESNLQPALGLEEALQTNDDPAVTTNATNVIATSPQYGVAIIPNSSNTTTTGDLPSETITVPTETLTDSTAKATEDKELHSTPSRNDRFKVVKIASLEPFKRGRWKCMDYVDEAPPAGAARVPQSAGSIQLTAGQYMQTQSLPQQQIQQMLLQSGFTNGTQFFTNVPPQMVPSGQYFYPQVSNVQSQTLPQVQTGMPTAQFIGGQGYFPVQGGAAAAFALPPGFQNVQYVPANLIPTQSGAFVPTSSVQVSQNFQQGQSFPAAQAGNSAQTMVNGHNYGTQNEQVAPTLPTQAVKSVVLNSGGGGNAQPIASQTQVAQQNMQNHVPGAEYIKTASAVPVIQNQQQQYHQTTVFLQQQQQQQQNVQPQQQQQTTTAQTGAAVPPPSGGQPTVEQPSLANNVYTNPQFAMSVNSLTALDGVNETSSAADAAADGGGGADDPAKTNPVVNAIDNKIEQAMDLVKSHLMYTVREEVEVLKEKIAELMEKIQQLETENNFLRSQIPKAQAAPPPAAVGPSAAANPGPGAAAPPPQQGGTSAANPSHNGPQQGHAQPPSTDGTGLQQQ